LPVPESVRACRSWPGWAWPSRGTSSRRGGSARRSSPSAPSTCGD